MGAQDEYLRNFCILLTEKGVVPLTDPLQISVYNELLGGMKRPSDLTSELKLSSSSLHFVIDKMADSGIIDRIKPENDKKSVYYTTSAKILASSTETNEKLKNASEETFVDPLKNYKGLSSLANMLDCYTSEIGLDIDPLKMKYADALADSVELEKAGIEDAILNVRDAFSRLTGYNFTVFSFSPLTLVVTGDENIKDKSELLMRFVVRMLENATGKSYSITGIEDFNGSDTMIKVSMERCEKAEEPYMNTSLFHKDNSRFLMVDVDGTAGLMTSDVQIDIVDAIYERPLCITDIVAKVDSPRSTITSNLLRMVEEGVISVFYSESGSAYYGLACSILLKKSRPISSDNTELRSILERTNGKDGSFLEGQLLYTLAYLRKLGFDSEYLMVVLGAKYMRATGSMEAQGSFDTYFGKMSDIAQAIGLSLRIVSIYPLTIGISSEDPESEMSQAMTFIKGMAHQGLEMTNSGIFVRSTEAADNNENISFKEIYPALSMTPVKGVMVEDLSSSATAKKRTSSVKTALLNRSKKDSGKPARTVRYITAAAFMLVLTAVLIFSVSSPMSDAKVCELQFDEDLDITVYDADGNELSSPYTVQNGSVVSLELSDPKDIGYVKGGIAYLIQPTDGGRYDLTVKSDLYIEQLYDVSSLKDLECTFTILCPQRGSAEPTLKPIDSERYMEESNGLYVNSSSQISVSAKQGYYITTSDDSTGGIISTKCDSRTYQNIKMKLIPVETRTIDLGNDAYYYDGKIVTNEIVIDGDVRSVELRYAGDKNVEVRMNGEEMELDSDKCFTLKVPPTGDIRLSSSEKVLY